MGKSGSPGVQAHPPTTAPGRNTVARTVFLTQLPAPSGSRNPLNPDDGRLLRRWSADGWFLLAFLWAGLFVESMRGQGFRINQIQIGGDNRPRIDYTASSNHYYLLLRSDSITNIVQPVSAALFSGTNGLMVDPGLVALSRSAFYTIREVPVSQPLDSDGDRLDDVYELLRPLYLNPLNPNDGPQTPETPIIAYPTNATMASFVIFTGRAPTNTLVRVEGGAAYVTNVVGGSGFFEVTVPLSLNRLNRLFVSAVNEFGEASPPAPVDILQDSTAPYLFIDFPTHGMVLTTDNTLVAGRVGDTLSGFLGLSVTVNGQPANVDVGIGPNGTYERMDVPLSLGTNELTVTATDRLGNSTTRSVQVIREAPTGPRLLALSGDLQQTNILRRLTEPLVVKVTQPGGTPIANKLVQFQVTRSDGRLLPLSTNQLAIDLTTRPDYSTNGVMLLQLVTDANGEARAWWTLGSDAGSANNRVFVSSTGITETAFFCASALALPARQINIGSGNNQRGETFGPAPEPLRVWVSDGNNPASGIPVTFRVTKGGGTLLPIVTTSGASPAGPGLRAASRPSSAISLAAAGTPPTTGSEEVTVFTSMTGHAEVDFTFGPAKGNHTVVASFPGNRGLPATFTHTALARVAGQPTTFVGLVRDNAAQPIGRARVELEVAGAHYEAFSDVQGRFAFSDIASGSGHLKVDGAFANALGVNAIPSNSFPSLQYTILVVPNAENSLPIPVLLPRLNTNNAQLYFGTNDLVVTCIGIEGLRMTIKANSMKHPGGEIVSPGRPALVSLNQVHHDNIPMPMPDGASPPFAWTLQPGGATFDPPVQVEYPNMSGLPPGAAAFFLTFNHDTERFEIVASGHVTEDGSSVVTDPGAGLTISGWGGNCPPYSVTGDAEGDCEGEEPAAFAAIAQGPTEPGCSESTPRFVRGNGGAPVNTLNHLEISTFVTTQNLDDSNGHVDPDNFKLEVKDTTVDTSTSQINVELEALKPSGASFSPSRSMPVTLRRVGSSKVFRSGWLRLVVTEADDTAPGVGDQTLLVSTDPNDASVEILGQRVRATYESESKELVVGENVLSMDINIHILSDVPTSGTHKNVAWILNPVTAAFTVEKYTRQFYAPANIKPGVVTAALVDPPANLVVIDDFDGDPASGNGQIRVNISSNRGGQVVAWPVLIYQTQLGVTPFGTATDIAALIRALPPQPAGTLSLDAEAFENPARNAAQRRSADILITDPNGGRMFVSASSTDTTQEATAPRVTDPNIGLGTRQERLLARNYSSSGPVIDIFVLRDTSQQAPNGVSVPLDGARSERNREPLLNSSFVQPFAFDDIDLPTIGTVSHEIGHLLMDVNHVTGDNTQLMSAEGGVSDRRSVNGGRRFRDASVIFDQIGGSGSGGQLNQINRMRASPLLHP